MKFLKSIFVRNGMPTVISFELGIAVALVLALISYDWGYRFIWPLG